MHDDDNRLDIAKSVFQVHGDPPPIEASPRADIL